MTATQHWVGKVVRVRDGMGFQYATGGDFGVVVSVDCDGDLWVKWNNPPITSSDNVWCCNPKRVEVIEECMV